MIEIEVSELNVSDVGCRVIVVRDGNALEGLLSAIWVNRSDFAIKGENKISTRITVKTEGSVLEVKDLPLDYRLQVERGVNK